MRVGSVLLTPIVGGYFYDDQAAIRAGARADGETILGRPRTPGFDAVRMPARGLAIGLVLEDGSVCWGDAISVQYPGVADRDPPLSVSEHLAALTDHVVPAMAGLDTGSFRAAERQVGELLQRLALGHRALEYGLSQALLEAAARGGRTTMTEVVCREYGLPLSARRVPIFAQTGDRRRDNADKMILKGVDVLPHGLINNLAKFGSDGGAFLEYVDWVAGRIPRLNPSSSYGPTLHFDLYGVAGEVFGDDTGALCAYLARVEAAARPYRVRIETPVIAGSRGDQIARLGAIRQTLRSEGIGVEIVADEWCNTLDDIRAFVAAGACDMVQIKMPDLGSVANSILAVGECRAAGIKAYLGGSCAETERSARVAVHVAVATQADVQLAKPGMGVDEGLMIVENEQSRLLAELTSRSTGASS